MDEQILTKMDAATDRYLALSVDDGTTEDTHNRFELAANGKMSFGSGSGAVDTNLYRNAANELKTDDLFTAALGVVAGSGYRFKIEAISFGATELGGSETNTSFTFTAGTVVLYAWYVVSDSESGTMDVGTQGTSDDPDGILDGVSLSSTGTFTPNATTTTGLNETYISAMTFGALTHRIFVGSDEAGEKGSILWRPNVITAADPVSITSSGDLNSCSGTVYIAMLVPTA